MAFGPRQTFAGPTDEAGCGEQGRPSASNISKLCLHARAVEEPRFKIITQRDSVHVQHTAQCKCYHEVTYGHKEREYILRDL